MKGTSLIVLNYNGRQFLKPCFDSVFSGKTKPFEVIMVDNNSSDGSVEFVEKNYPQIKILKMSENFGFAKAVNQGIKEARGEYIACLNNDTEVEKNWLYELEKAAKEHKEVGFFASKMVWLKNPSIIDSAGIVYSWKGKAYDRGKGEKDGDKFSKKEYVFGACNGASFFKKEVFEKIGYLDENFFLICDDVDFSFRAQLAGFKCLFVPTAVVKHAGGGTVGTWSEKKATYSARHHIYILLKNSPLDLLLINLPQIIIERLRNLSGLIKSASPLRAPLVVFQAYFEVLKRMPEMLKKRKEIQLQRKVSNDYLLSLIKRADFSAD